MIQIRNLTVTYGRRAAAVDDVSFDVAPGQSLALWGANGAGKTTVIRCVLGLLRYTGRVAVGGFDARHHGKPARQLIGYVPQELAFYDDLRVADALRFFGRLKSHPVADPSPVLDRVGLLGHDRKRVRELSGGMKQRLALAIALLGDPPVLVLDEVTASLDACGRSDFVALLSHLARNDGRVTLFASHRVEEIDAVATRVITLQRGRVTADLDAKSFVARQTPATLLHLFLDPQQRDAAVATLRARGYDARLNGRGIFVPVPTGPRVEPLHLLSAASLRVLDFELLTENARHD